MEKLFQVFSEKPGFRKFPTSCFNCIYCSQIVRKQKKFYSRNIALISGCPIQFAVFRYLLLVPNESGKGGKNVVTFEKRKNIEDPTLGVHISTSKGRISKIPPDSSIPWLQDSIRVKKVGGQKITCPLNARSVQKVVLNIRPIAIPPPPSGGRILI